MTLIPDRSKCIFREQNVDITQPSWSNTLGGPTALFDEGAAIQRISARIEKRDRAHVRAWLGLNLCHTTWADVVRLSFSNSLLWPGFRANYALPSVRRCCGESHMTSWRS